MPMTEQGFRKYTYAELLEQQIIRAKDLFGDDIDTSGKSVLGKYIRLNVSDFAQQEEALEALYQARYVDTACGVSLDRLAPFAGLQRNAAVAAVLALVLYNHGKSEVELPMGTKLVNSDGTLYRLTQRITIAPGSSVQAHAACDTAGEIGNATKPLRFSQVQQPNITISYRSLLPIAVTGADTESDPDFRRRWKKAVAGAGSGTADAVMGAVARLDSVQDVVLYENDSDIEQEVGTFRVKLPPHSFAVIVKGAEDASAEIARTIFQKKPLGIQAKTGSVVWNAVTERVADSAGIFHEIQFGYAASVPITVEVTINKADEPDFQPATAKPLFAAALQAYFSGSRIGQGAYANALYVPLIQSGAVSCIAGIQVRTRLTPSAAKVTIGVDEYLTFSDVVITYKE